MRFLYFLQSNRSSSSSVTSSGGSAVTFRQLCGVSSTTSISYSSSSTTSVCCLFQVRLELFLIYQSALALEDSISISFSSASSGNYILLFETACLTPYARVMPRGSATIASIESSFIKRYSTPPTLNRVPVFIRNIT